jgi:predicted kinase
MAQPILYLMMGHPGAGKTTAAQALHAVTGAVHLWVDHERRRKFSAPTYTHRENLSLYKQLNNHAEALLKKGESVIYDTNFSLYKDRQHLRERATANGAKTVVLWVSTLKEIARSRATDNAHLQGTRVLGNMAHETFERMSRNLEPPRPDEHAIELDGTQISKDYLKSRLPADLL